MASEAVTGTIGDCCVVCGRTEAEVEWFVLLQGRRGRLHCSSVCLADSVEAQRRARAARVRRRWLAVLSLGALAAGAVVVRRHIAPPPEWICGGPAEPLPEAPPPAPIPYGPAWPPTDDEWRALFGRARWIYPLPGPVRRAFTSDGEIFGPAATASRGARCRTDGHCGVDLGGELWGEHIYAAQEGVVDRVQGFGHEEHGGQYVRLTHFGGMVFTEYFHLAAIPRGIVRGAHVKAGELIGLLGDTGTDDGPTPGRRHLCFALSVRPSPELQEVFWDPSPWMTSWPMRIPPNGTVAGLVPTGKQGDMPRRRRSE